MIKLFNWRKPDIKSVSLSDADWVEGDATKTVRKWGDVDGTMAISLNFFEGAPDIPTLSDLDVLRQYYRDAIAPTKGALIEVEMIKIHGIQCVRTILKFPQTPSGFIYLTSLTVPFAMCSYVVKIQAPELDVTGMRETFISNKLLRDKVITIDGNLYTNWLLDPYKADYKGEALMNRSEEVRWDIRFPSHPLTKSRNLMAEIEKGIGFDQKLLDLKRFDK